MARCSLLRGWVRWGRRGSLLWPVVGVVLVAGAGVVADWLCLLVVVVVGAVWCVGGCFGALRRELCVWFLSVRWAWRCWAAGCVGRLCGFPRAEELPDVRLGRCSVYIGVGEAPVSVAGARVALALSAVAGRASVVWGAFPLVVVLRGWCVVPRGSGCGCGGGVQAFGEQLSGDVALWDLAGGNPLVVLPHSHPWDGFVPPG